MATYIESLKQRFTVWKKKWSCDHDYEIVHEDNAVRLERCKNCSDLVKFGG